jgi:hypothetical protein
MLALNRPATELAFCFSDYTGMPSSDKTVTTSSLSHGILLIALKRKLNILHYTYVRQVVRNILQ